MNKTKQIFVGYFLLICLSATLIPFSLLHHHENEDHCHEINIKDESVLCHNKVYHKDIQEQTCDHNTHFSDWHDGCELCQFLITKRNQYTANKSKTPTAFTYSVDYFETNFSYYHRIDTYSILGRAPPTL